MRRRFGIAGVLGAIAALVLVASGCTSSGAPQAFPPLPSPSVKGPDASPQHPNIVFVLTDDLSDNLLPYMPHVQQLMRSGMSFSNYTVTDSLCCPSRASIFSGRFPHDTHVLANTMPQGGFSGFYSLHEEKDTFATTLHAAGYQTAFMGKYLNGYQPQTHLDGQPGAYVPPGWSTWMSVGARGYREYEYDIADGHATKVYGTQPEDYLGTVLDHRASTYIHQAAGERTPFMLEVATFAPHKFYVPAPIDQGTFSQLAYPRTLNFNSAPRPAPAWMRGRIALPAREQLNERRIFDLRVEAVQGVDRMIGHIEQALQETGQAKNTVLMFSSDNGYHLGEYTLPVGKQTAFDTDIRVPLVVAGPGVAAGSVNRDVVENIDLRPTFEELAGAATPSTIDGRSLVPLLHAEDPPWRTVALVEHHHPPNTPTDPDFQTHYAGNPPSYTAIRTAKWVYIRYVTGDREYYDLVADPYELHNLGPQLSRSRVAVLDRTMDGLVDCHDASACWRAASPGNG